MINNNLIRFNATSIGLGNFVVATAFSGCVTPEQAFAIDGKSYVYMARSADGTQYESGKGVYTYAGHVHARTTVYASSSANQKVDFATIPIVDVFPAPTKLEAGEFPAGTRTDFQQATAPPGWTRSATFNDATIRILGSGVPGSGGSNGFSTVMAQTTVGNTTLGPTQLPDHQHDPTGGFTNFYGDAPGNVGNMMDYSGASGTGAWSNPITGNMHIGGNAFSHNHTISLNIKYVDFIIASKD